MDQVGRTRRFAVVLALAAVLVAGSAASAHAASVYEGFFKGARESHLKLRFDTHAGKRYLDFIRYERVHASCDETSAAHLSDKRSFRRHEVRVRHGRFEFEKKTSQDDVFRIAGTLRNNSKGKATGTFRYKGEVADRGVCDTGRLDWVADKTS